MAVPPLPQRSFQRFLAGVAAEAHRQGISARTTSAALDLAGPNSKVLQLDRHQPEFTLTWARYQAIVLSGSKISIGRAEYARHLPLLQQLWSRFHVDPRVILGIWGLESAYGRKSGTYGVIESLATLAFDGRRATFFRQELIKALQVMEQTRFSAGQMLGSYAGAMGQPQFMPSSYLRFAVAYDGGSRADIWTVEADVLASIANYLMRSGWVDGAPWGQAVRLPAGFGAGLHGRLPTRSLADWMQLGIRRPDGSRFSRGDVEGALLLPDGPTSDAFIVYRNFDVIRRYNPSDFYALAVGLLGNASA